MAEPRHYIPTWHHTSRLFWQRMPRILAVVGATLAVGLIALLPRVLGLADFYTTDEAFHWQERVRLFAQALHARHWLDTNQTGHPGVTLMWLGTAGRWLAAWAHVAEAGGDGVGYLAYLRLPVAVVNSLCVACGYLLLRRLLRAGVALLAATFWATSPFLIAHSRLLHLDALVTSFMTLSLLLLLVAAGDWQPAIEESRQAGATAPRSFASARWLLLGSGIFAGLALLTKAPALILVPFTALLLLISSPCGGVRSRVRWAMPRFLSWCGCAAVVAFVLWPALWVAPGSTIASVLHEIIANGEEPHKWGNFFAGQPVADPGWRFYPAVIVWRSTPATVFGLLLAPSVLRASRGERRVLLALAAYILLLTVVLALSPKKFDRYLLPAWPALEICAAIGVARFARWLSALISRAAVLRPWIQQPVVPLLATVALCGTLLMTDLGYQPYYLAYYNPLLGGGAAAQRSLLIGWSEGMDQAGAWLRARPDIGDGPVLATNEPTLTPFVPVPVHYLYPGNLHLANYAVLYISDVQRQAAPDVLVFFRQLAPLYTVTIRDIPYATVYQLPRPYDEPTDVTFDGWLHLRGISHELVSNTLVITPSWDVQADHAGGMFSFIHVLAASKQRVAQIDLPVDVGRFPTWQAGQQFGLPLRVPLPAALPPGSYDVVLGVYDPASGARLAVTHGATLPVARDGPEVIRLMTIDIP